jgi:hypothetical protein
MRRHLLFFIVAVAACALLVVPRGANAQAGAAAVPNDEPSSALPEWLNVTPTARFRSQADWLVDMGLLSPKDAYGPFPSRAYAEGDTEQFYALDFLSTAAPRKLTATLGLVTEHAYWWFEDGATYDPAALKQAGDRFEQYIYPLDRKIFGEEANPGIDGDPHIFILHQLKLGAYAVGVFSLRDQCPTRLCPSSNQHELIYVGLDYAPVGSDQHMAVIGHEFQHLIQNNVDGNEERWLNEGLSQLAEHLNGFNPRDISSNGVRSYFRNPNLQLNAWPANPADDPSSNYGMGYLFSLYLHQRFGTAYIEDLARSPYQGLASVAQTLDEMKTGVTLAQVFTDWSITNYINTPYAGDGRYYYQSLRLGTRPAVKELTPDVAERARLQNYASAYYLLPDAGSYQITFRGEARARLGPPRAASGTTMWWSYNEQRGIARLEREVDLTGKKSATLNYNAWWDTAPQDASTYVLASGDDGKTWNILRGAFTTRCEVRLYCYEGKSQGWVAESVDLSAYAGKKARIRFDYLTTPANPSAGFFLDDIRVDAVGFTDDVETLDRGWTVQGFMRVPATVSQRWAVTSVSRGDPITVTPYTVDENDNMTATLKVAKDGALIVVNHMTPLLYGDAAYTITARKQ